MFFFSGGKYNVGLPSIYDKICSPLYSGRSGSSSSKYCVPHFKDRSFCFLFHISRKTITLLSKNKNKYQNKEKRKEKKGERNERK